MKQLSLFMLLAGTANPLLAETCTGPADTKERLACFDSARSCSGIESDSQRLECFDRVFSPDAIADENVEASVATPVVSGVAEPEVESGKRWREESETAPSIQAVIIEVKANPYKEDYLRLDNGQLWREIEDSRVRFKPDMKVTITKGVLNSFDMKVEGVSRRIKVERIK